MQNSNETDFARIKSLTYGNVFGNEGIFRTSINLIEGEPGDGKTTFLLQLADEIAGVEKREVIFLTLEESASTMSELASRVSLPNSKTIRIISDPNKESNNADTILRRKPAAVVIDSLHQLVGERTSDMNEALVLCGRLALECRCPFFIAQPTFENKSTDVLQVECITELFVAVNGNRTLEVIKNRYGRALIKQQFQMTKKGLVKYGRLNTSAAKEN
jgi:KaiC